MKKYVVALVALCVLLVFGVAPLFAQAPSPINPTRIEFAASPDHSILVGQEAVVDHYEFQTVSFADNTVVIFTTQLGKPTPNAQSLITAAIAQFQTLANGVYQGKVIAVGPGGASGAALSLPFGRIGTPAAAGRAVILP